jgi:hypothetical protein
MPLVFAQNEKSAAGVVYADKLGVSYEYPARYRSLIREGERFVYYRGKRREDDSTQVPHYFGTGFIGKITQSGGLNRCAIVDFQPFDPIVPFKIGGRYLEQEANTKISKEVGLHYRQGVRKIDQEAFEAICKQGLKSAPKKRDEPKLKRLKRTDQTKALSSSELEKLTLQLALTECRKRWPNAKSFLAVTGSPFSIAVHVPKDETHYISVKATGEPEPYIRLTAEEVQYSKSHATTYSLWVYYEADVQAGTARLASRDGPITEEHVDLQAALHGGRLRTTKKGKRVGSTSD